MRGDVTVLVGVSTDDLHDEALQGVIIVNTILINS